LQGSIAPYTLSTLRVPDHEVQPTGDTCFCTTFTRGTGQEWRIGIIAEQWLEEGNIALYASVLLQKQHEVFHGVGKSFPVNPSVFPGIPDFVSEYILSTDILQISLDVGAKYKFYPLPLFISLGIGTLYRLQSLNRLVERLSVSAVGHYNFPEQEYPSEFFRVLPFGIASTLRLGADVALANGIYASPALFASIQLREIYRYNLWAQALVGVHIALLAGW
ncbi:MAG: hypothetical protein RML40_11215, partial [Bacteroidota bacterium]|nr:hypothetical protein [Candidatus Kapabacteria bacterium]MDW8221084.1 hypothetical protein [Bacteroidota bacterium]